MFKFCVHQSHRIASLVLIFAFILGFILVLMSKLWLDTDILIRLWFLLSIMPLCLLAYRQNHQTVTHTPNPTNWQRIRGKSLVLLLQCLCIFVVAFILVELDLVFYVSFVNDMFFLTPALIPLIIFYVYFSDRRMLEPDDEYAKIAEMLSQRMPFNKIIFKKFALKTLVKIVFVPFMYSGFLGNLNILLNTDLAWTAPAVSVLLYNIVVSIDMLIGIFGYFFSSVLLDNQIKDADDNWMGWLFALLCYPPLSWLTNQVNKQQDMLIWSDILPADSYIYWIFFFVINALWIIYWLATFEFGMTFSNLSWRKLVDRGVYRYTKHPAYISKNLYWWLHTLPFCGFAMFSLQWWQNILGLTFLSLLYYGRAWSEERHLSKFAEYRAYQDKINKHGIFRMIPLPPCHNHL